ncbi:predicted protein [Chaetomium globosum CBS 148.51]|uniref:Uncharacterized protein n=1 Tax=Chaetomium globosum (strain ATCC 6205 / CBS 148.51 / DSM 1962 / NBRC 6347 / NRRL 1970) TaxID=306901 RepID=Q2GM77_CHAGB|nr:uncharacterized protein CHGG_10927 [Chaetomium globosum CBS 148.51]EAQ83109.1 predicted protein [Chaetomium globosum CBS 148.51]
MPRSGRRAGGRVRQPSDNVANDAHSPVQPRADSNGEAKGEKGAKGKQSGTAQTTTPRTLSAPCRSAQCVPAPPRVESGVVIGERGPTATSAVVLPPLQLISGVPAASIHTHRASEHGIARLVRTG